MTDAIRPTALITGVGRSQGIGAGLAHQLATDGWDLCLAHWTPYDERLGLDRGDHDAADVADACRSLGAAVTLVEGDLADPDIPEGLVAAADGAHEGHLKALVLNHCESVNAGIEDATLESWDRHFAVNARAAWLLIRAYAARLPVVDPAQAAAFIVALTSDVAAHNLPYGASKGALDRIIVAAAHELADRGVRANAINPGPTDTGWMDDAIRTACRERTPAGRTGTPADAARLVSFLLSERGSWINAQVLNSNGGFA